MSISSARIEDDLNTREGAHTLGAHVLQFVGSDGKTVDITPHNGRHFDVEPLDFARFVKVADGTDPSFPVVISNGQAAADITGLENDGPLTVRATMSGTNKILGYGLVGGGWLPMPWAHKRTALFDRNIVIKLEQFQEQFEALAGGLPRPRLVEYLGLDVDTVSPLLFGLEGSTQRPPTRFQVHAELTRATRALAGVLPGAKLQSIGPVQRKAIYNMVQDHAPARANAMRLLLKAAPMVVDRVKREERLELEGQLVKMAQAEQVPRTSLTVLALLSCVYDANPSISTHRAATPGRALLKPSVSYDVKKAYNALADLFALEMLHNMHAIFPGIEPVLYTQDVGMSALWTATQPCERQVIVRPNGMVATTVTFPLDKGLFPALSGPEVIALKHRLDTAG